MFPAIINPDPYVPAAVIVYFALGTVGLCIVCALLMLGLFGSVSLSWCIRYGHGRTALGPSDAIATHFSFDPPRYCYQTLKAVIKAPADPYFKTIWHERVLAVRMAYALLPLAWVVDALTYFPWQRRAAQRAAAKRVAETLREPEAPTDPRLAAWNKSMAASQAMATAAATMLKRQFAALQKAQRTK